MTEKPDETEPTTAPDDEVAGIVAFAMDCARQGESDLLARYLDGGFPANHPDGEGNTALMLAAYHGHAGTVAMLLARGADPDRLNARGQSPLAGAIFKGEDDVVARLLAGGADPDVGTPSARATAEMFGRRDLLE
jgi:ankyrin repeat protein